MHPIFQWLDYSYKDYGGFAKVTDDRFIGGFRNRLVAGVNILNGSIDNQQFANLGGQKGALLSSSIDRSKNTSLYVEDSFYFLPNVAAIAGTQFLYATRNRQDRILSDGDASGATEFRIWSPKAGLLWNVDPTWQVFGNISRSAEVPSFGESSTGPGIPFIPFTSIRPQIATTYEIGTRMKRPDYAWELTAYRANIRNELQCLYSAFGNCNVTNADRTIHQGIEAGAGAAIFRGIFNDGPAPDKLWLNLAYTFNDFRFDNDATFGNNLLPGAPRHYLRAELLYKNPTGFYFGPNVEWVPQAYFVDSANTVKTEAYALLGTEGGLRQWRPGFGLYRGTQSAQQGLHRQHQHHQSGDRDVAVVRARQRPGGLCRHEVPMVRSADMYRRYLLTSASALVLPLVFASDMAAAQTSDRQLPPVTVEAPGAARPSVTRPARDGGRAARQRRARAPAAAPPVVNQPAVNQPAVVQTTAGAVQGYRALTASSATKTDTPLERIPQNIVVIPRSVIDDQGATTVSEAALNVSNVQPVDTRMIGNVAQAPVKIRGFDAEMWIDGYPGNLFVAGDRDGLANVERIEVLKGPNALLYGGGAGSPVGGAINVISKLPTDKARYEVGGTFGSYQYWNPYFDINQPLNDSKTALFRITGEYGQSKELHRRAHAEPLQRQPDPDVDQSRGYQADHPGLRIGAASTSLSGPAGGRHAFWRVPGAERPLLRRSQYPAEHFAPVWHDSDRSTTSSTTYGQRTSRARWSQSDIRQLSQSPLNDATFTGGTPVFPPAFFDVNEVDVLDRQQEFSINPSVKAKFALGPTTNTLLFGADYSQVKDSGYMNSGSAGTAGRDRGSK